MTRKDLILAALAASNGAEHSPVQVQKLLFLLDKRHAAKIEGPKFDFKPYDYGPFDSSVYRELEYAATAREAEIDINADLRRRKYRLTPQGQQSGEQVLKSLGDGEADYVRRLSSFVRSLSFSQLVSAVYKAYPEMKENSIFKS